MNCPACKQEIKYAGETLKCTGCSIKYHYACQNMTSAYYVENNFELMKCWRCQDCTNVTRRYRNDNTPIRKTKVQTLNDTTMSIDEAQDEQNSSITKNNECRTPDYNNQTTSKTQETLPEGLSITLDSLSKLLDSKLEKNNQSLLSVLKNTIEKEIQKNITKLKEDIFKDTHKLTHEQGKIKNDIKTINKEIETLQKENKELKQQLKEIKQNMTTIGNPQQDSFYKKIVLFGLTERDHESENELEYRVVEAFKDILNVDLTGYIEGLSRIGRNNSFRRPIVIELISKRMTKYILDNATYFKHTGLFISEYLNVTALRQKKILQENLRLARQQGHHAIIKNNKLIVDGRRQELTATTKQNTATTKQNTATTKTDFIQPNNDSPHENSNTRYEHETDLSRTNMSEIRTFRHPR